MKSVEDVVRSKAIVPITPEEDFLIMEGLRRVDKDSVAKVAGDLSLRSIPLFRKRFLKSLKLKPGETAGFNEFFYGENYTIVAGIAKKMAQEVKAAEDEKINGRRILYEKIGHPFSKGDLLSSDMDIIQITKQWFPLSALKMAFARGSHRNYYIYYVRLNEKTPLQVLPRFLKLYAKTIGANLKKIKGGWLSYRGSEAGQAPMSIEEGEEYRVWKSRGSQRGKKKKAFSLGQGRTKEASDRRKKRRATGEYLLGEEIFYSIPYIVKELKIPQTTLYRWSKGNTININVRYVEGVGRIKLVNRTDLINIQIKKERKESLREWVRDTAKEKGISEAGARQIFCRKKKRKAKK